MANIPEVNAARLAELGLAQQTTNTAPTKELGQEEFLDLLVAQLQYQDPLKPLENAEFVSQIAQFSSVSGLSEIQSSLSDLVGAFQSNQALQASTLVGRDVLLAGDKMNLVVGTNPKGQVETPAGTTTLRVEVFAANGELVRRIDTAPNVTGRTAFEWDGLNDAGEAMPAGVYRIQAIANGAGGDIAASTFVQAKVDSVSLSRNPPSTILNLSGLGTVDVLDVREFL
ncbi:MAG: flagellar hook assembly protein FlgD [Pseudomonadota bacterium]